MYNNFITWIPGVAGRIDMTGSGESCMTAGPVDQTTTSCCVIIMDNFALCDCGYITLCGLFLRSWWIDPHVLFGDPNTLLMSRKTYLTFMRTDYKPNLKLITRTNLFKMKTIRFVL